MICFGSLELCISLLSLLRCIDFVHGARPVVVTTTKGVLTTRTTPAGRPIVQTTAKTGVTTSSLRSTSTPINSHTGSSGTSSSAAASATSSAFSSTLKGKVLYGYQAWFGTVSNYTHWSFQESGPVNSTSQFDFYPDTTQYPAECLFDSGFHYANGTTLKLYTAACEGVIATHFRWMNEAGIDGVIVQRFVVNRVHPAFTTILNLVRKYCEMYNKVFMVEYDLSDLSTDDVNNLTAIVAQDWDDVIKPVTTSSAYLHEGGKPAFMVFGEGIRTNISPQQCQTLNTQLKSFGTHLILAPNWPWYRAYQADTTDPYAPAYNQADTISPWAVGSYAYGNDYTNQHQTRKAAQDPILAANNQTYAPVIWPGFSWHNLMYNGNNPPVQSNYDLYPRYNGDFFVQQINTVLADNSTYFIMIAMFDEVNEGTACAPTLKTADLPVDGTFVGSDSGGDPGSMFYLNSGGALGRSLKSKLNL